MCQAYAQASQADRVIRKYAENSRWFALKRQQRQQLLMQATEAIDRMPGFKGAELREGRAFPRDCYPEIPNAVTHACILEAFARTDKGKTERFALIQQGVTRASIGNASEQYGQAKVSPLISHEAMLLLNPFLQRSFHIC